VTKGDDDGMQKRDRKGGGRPRSLGASLKKAPHTQEDIKTGATPSGKRIFYGEGGGGGGGGADKSESKRKKAAVVIKPLKISRSGKEHFYRKKGL